MMEHDKTTADLYLPRPPVRLPSPAVRFWRSLAFLLFATSLFVPAATIAYKAPQGLSAYFPKVRPANRYESTNARLPLRSSPFGIETDQSFLYPPSNLPPSTPPMGYRMKLLAREAGTVESVAFIPPPQGRLAPSLVALKNGRVLIMETDGARRSAPLPAIQWSEYPQLSSVISAGGTRFVALAKNPHRAVCFTEDGEVLWEVACLNAEDPAFDEPLLSVLRTRNGQDRIFLHSRSCWGVRVLDPEGGVRGDFPEVVAPFIWGPLSEEDWPKEDILLVDDLHRTWAMDTTMVDQVQALRLAPQSQQSGWASMPPFAVLNDVALRDLLHPRAAAEARSQQIVSANPFGPRASSPAPLGQPLDPTERQVLLGNPFFQSPFQAGSQLGQPLELLDASGRFSAIQILATSPGFVHLANQENIGRFAYWSGPRGWGNLQPPEDNPSPLRQVNAFSVGPVLYMAVLSDQPARSLALYDLRAL